MQCFDFVIIGNGAIGLSIAYSLITENPNLKIAIIGPKARAGAASMAAGAMLGCFGEVSSTTFNSEAGLAKLTMSVEAKTLWPAWLGSLNAKLPNDQQVHRQKGTYIIVNARSGKLDDRRFKNILLALNQFNEPHQETDWQQVAGLAPVEDCRPFHCLYLPEEHSINPSQLILAIETVLNQNKNIRFFDDQVNLLNSHSNNIEYVTLTNNEKVSGKNIIIAAGAYSQKLLDTLPDVNLQIPKILAAVGCAAEFKHNENITTSVIRTPNRAGACGLHAVTHQPGQTYIGATNFIAPEPEILPRAQYSYYLLQRALEQVNQNFYNAVISKWHVGNRPFSIDSFPLLGPTPVNNLWLATGNYRDGLHNAPLIGKQFTQALLYEQSASLNPLFYPVRKPIQTLTQAESIEEFAYQMMGAAYEHSMHLPRVGWDNEVVDMMKHKAKMIYAQLDIDVGLPVEMLLFLDRHQELIHKYREYYQTFPCGIA
jgi:glycine oxidase